MEEAKIKHKMHEVEQIKLNVNGERIKPVDTTVNLGMTFDQHLSWKHIEGLWKESIGKH